MTRITATTFCSLDGVTQAPGGPDEDRSNGFERGGWSAPFDDDDFGTFMTGVFARAGAFLLGRHTYDIFSSYWPHHDPDGDPIANPLNRLPKYVASRTLRDPAWAPTTVLDGDLERQVPEARDAVPAGDDGAERELQVHGSVRLTQWLLAHGLLDEHHVLTFPVVVGGGGRRLFADDAPATAMQLVSNSVTSTGVVVATYRPTGPATYGLMGE